jgi:hypothetical protein
MSRNMKRPRISGLPSVCKLDSLKKTLVTRLRFATTLIVRKISRFFGEKNSTNSESCINFAMRKQVFSDKRTRLQTERDYAASHQSHALPGWLSVKQQFFGLCFTTSHNSCCFVCLYFADFFTFLKSGLQHFYAPKAIWGT